MRTGNENGNAPPAPDGILHVAFVLDGSGSMQIVEEAVVGGYNDYLRELREQGGQTLFSLTTFHTSFTHVYISEPLDEVAELDHRNYRPGGCTALYDAIGHTVIRTERRLQHAGRDEEKVLVVVMTDGLENSSTDYDEHTIAELVRSYDQRPNWTFVYLGAGHDTIEAAKDAAALIRFKTDNAMRWTADPASARMTMQALARATDLRRQSTALKSERFFADAGQSQADYQRPRAGHAQAFAKANAGDPPLSSTTSSTHRDRPKRTEALDRDRRRRGARVIGMKVGTGQPRRPPPELRSRLRPPLIANRAGHLDYDGRPSAEEEFSPLLRTVLTCFTRLEPDVSR